MYNDLDIRCSFEKCKKIVKLIDLAKHEANCQRAKCWNYDNCEGNESIPNPEAFPCCSQVCALLKSIVSCGGDQKRIYDEIKKFFDKSKVSMISVVGSGAPSSAIGMGSSGYGVPLNTGGVQSSLAIKWDPTKAGQGIEITDGGQTVFLKEQSYVFRTVVS